MGTNNQSKEEPCPTCGHETGRDAELSSAADFFWEHSGEGFRQALDNHPRIRAAHERRNARAAQ